MNVIETVADDVAVPVGGSNLIGSIDLSSTSGQINKVALFIKNTGETPLATFILAAQVGEVDSWIDLAMSELDYSFARGPLTTVRGTPNVLAAGASALVCLTTDVFNTLRIYASASVAATTVTIYANELILNPIVE
jgi:hypothetical protein